MNVTSLTYTLLLPSLPFPPHLTRKSDFKLGRTVRYPICIPRIEIRLWARARAAKERGERVRERPFTWHGGGRQGGAAGCVRARSGAFGGRKTTHAPPPPPPQKKKTGKNKSPDPVGWRRASSYHLPINAASRKARLSPR
ncbi:hypothetical protein LZ31DRAFT_144021 [Colletotrichum somersetense]|nr:hypothetical protein LZ31DRAFT_144021 [Colletotrichum somersetense]